MSNRDAIIILASVGTTVIRAKEVTYAQIQKELADYSGLEVLQVFTDDSAAHAMSEPDDRVYTVEEALERAIAKGYSKVIAVPVFMTKGQLYNELKSRLDFYLDRLEIKMTDSVLYDAESCREFVEIFETIHTPDPKREYLFVEHGNPYYHCAANGCSRLSSQRSRNITHIVTPRQQHQSLRSRPMLSTARLQALRRTAVKLINRLRRAATRPTAQSRMV
jgi:cobalamin biosynthesis Co2+ chelatase CbiK